MIIIVINVNRTERPEEQKRDCNQIKLPNIDSHSVNNLNVKSTAAP